jgi:hypothetical protein
VKIVSRKDLASYSACSNIIAYSEGEIA